ncbi:primosomal protein N' [Paenibacillus glucanolyticus]|jgi:primosomal protein N' (replication factor Y)|uniref:primosomal protein N' n=1 Tax=Paenibacillus TaxID=44249 RepID=UPI0003E21BEB|nr:MULTISPECIES: primosomal protein N' [Paenibacillus]ANA81811.1 primosomal protein N' [Paenibacillus glucanolyticus]AVV59458.1 primosomal protein N' [Paenibacillus glucanolyticus]ETT43228.1 primosomal protein N' [Paenibacillus sp. FSL R5-808]MPY16011.1 primosomal protein N' [Paenibacillus glucanolyticus]
MEMARVIVDVPSKDTDRPFDYLIPEDLRPWIEVGSRVGVPFGHRTLQGLVVSLHPRPEMDTAKMKPIQEVLDVMPPLSPELIEVGEWMKERYACRHISALQSMLPTALKGKAERYISLAHSDMDMDSTEEADGLFALLPESELEQQIIRFVGQKGEVSLQQLSRAFPDGAATIKALIGRGRLSEFQQIKDKLQKKTMKAIELAVSSEEASTALASFPAKAQRQKEVLQYILEMEDFLPISQKDLLQTLGVTAGTVKALADKGLITLEDVEVFRDPYRGRNFTPSTPLALTQEQQVVYRSIVNKLDEREHGVFLLHGVTGSGKTEIYLQTIQRCLEQERQAIVLVPEISLTPQMVERFKARFGDRVAVMHSRLSDGERYDEWRKIREGRASVVVGARSAVFAPFDRLGLIIMDEEHETSYKQEETPKYHARDVAIHRASLTGAAVILGSATPSLESYHAAKSQAQDHFAPQLLEMPSRALGNRLPEVQIVDMREELREGNRSMFSRSLHAAITTRLERGEQTVLLLNRRGYSTFVMCRSCGYVAGCPECDISLTYHQKSNNLRCHYCGYAAQAPEVCPDCGSEHIRYFGTGTQRVEEELAKLFPGIRVIRMDVDTTTEKGSHEKLLKQFRDKKGDVLLGTQMVAKGLDFPDVTLVGVITADSALNLPDFRAAEKTFQLLTQVAGRAGRHQLPGEVVIQSYTPEHYSIIHASSHDYLSFVKDELKHRKALHYPPYCRLILVTLSHEQLPLLVRMAENFAAAIKSESDRRGWFGSLDRFDASALDILGPVASPIPRLKNRYRFQCMIKWRGTMDAVSLVRVVAEKLQDSARDSKLQISIDVDPQMLM